MADKLHIKILTAEKVLCDREAAMVIAPAYLGEMGILPEHIAFLCALDTGVLRIKEESIPNSREEVYAVHGGFLRVYEDDILILATAAERRDAINLARAKKSKARAEERLQKRDLPEMDAERAEASLKRADVRMTVAEGRWMEVPKAEEDSTHKA
jgi:F-type H+-transporting ATPase subunit epsilon